MASNSNYATTSMVATRWYEPRRASSHGQILEKWVALGLLGAGGAALALWIRVILQMVHDITLASAAYFGS